MPPVDKLGRRIVALMAGDGVKPIRAYHGSPHNFDRFDASKIGTGEGAQAYGHGLYFAGAEDTARTYRDRLSGGIYVDGVPLSDAISESGLTESPWHRDIATSLSNGEDLSDEVDWARRTWQQASEEIRANPRDAGAHHQLRDFQGYLDAYDFLSKRNVNRRRGHMYEVELGVPEGTLMDWDAPLSSQPLNFMQVLRAYDAVPELPSSVPWEPVGEQAYRRLVDRISMSGPARKGQMPPARAAVAAADALRSGGVLGMRYLDAGSRSAGQGTHNYVMFPGTEDHIRILRKYGLLAPMALPALQEGE